MTSTTYRLYGFLKHSEIFSLEEGCPSDTANSQFIEYTIAADCIAGIIEQASEFIYSYGITGATDNIQVNACDEPGRIDFTIMEDAEGIQASEFDLQQWRKGAKELYCCTYSANVLKVQSDFLIDSSVLESVTLWKRTC